MDDQDVWLALALVALILAGVEVVRSRFVALLPWAVVAVSLALCFAWWPN